MGAGDWVEGEDTNSVNGLVGLPMALSRNWVCSKSTRRKHDEEGKQAVRVSGCRQYR